MKKSIIFLLLISIATSSCNKCKIEKYIPGCIEEKVKEFCKTKNCATANVEQYLFQSQTVFVFSPGTCGADQTAEVLNTSCNSLGFLGGFSGNTIINGEEFTNATFVRTVWKQEE